MLLQPLPYRNPQQLYRIREIVPQMAKSYSLLDANLQDFLIWQKQCHSFSQIAIAESTSAVHTGDGPAEELYGLRASATLLDVLGIRPQQGRAFFPEEDRPRQRNLDFNVMRDKQSEVMGVVGNVLHNGLAEPVRAESYVPFGAESLGVRMFGGT